MGPTALFYDFETSGLPDWHQPSDAPQQPHIVQAAALLVDTSTWNTIQSINLIVSPNGWEIPQQVVDIHGITTNHARLVGIPEIVVLNLIDSMWRKADFRVAHSESFDARIMRIAYKRFLGDEFADEWKAGNAECTGKLAKPIMQITGRRIPKLSEAYEFFTGEPMDASQAHSAMYDTLACLEVFKHAKPKSEAEEPLQEPATDITF